jgi:hypothetical protein
MENGRRVGQKKRRAGAAPVLLHDVFRRFRITHPGAFASRIPALFRHGLEHHGRSREVRNELAHPRCETARPAKSTIKAGCGISRPIIVLAPAFRFRTLATDRLHPASATEWIVLQYREIGRFESRVAFGKGDRHRFPTGHATAAAASSVRATRAGAS